MKSLTMNIKKRCPLRHGMSLLAMTWLLACLSMGLWLIFGGGKSPAPHAPSSTPRYITKNIEDVQVGDYVLAKDPGDSGPPTPHRVIALPRNWTEHVVHVRVRGDAEIQATRMHPFWVQGKGWTDAVDLKPGDRLRDEKDQLVSVLGATVESRTTGTFNLTVEGVHTFYVMAGKRTLLVHNAEVPFPLQPWPSGPATLPQGWPTPPGWNGGQGWANLPASAEHPGFSLWDPNGGEWNFHSFGGSTDWHPEFPNGHWDYNSWNHSTDQWQRLEPCP